ncbi:MAG: hypothetical protein ACTJG2_04135 [Candidatus Saccharimonadales bacterium]
MKIIQRWPLLFLIALFSVSVFFAGQANAQENIEEGVSSVQEGVDVSDSPKEEFFYWDRRDGKDVIIGKGSSFTKEVILEKDAKQEMGGDLETYTIAEGSTDEVLDIKGWLPISLREMEFDKGEQETCGLDPRIPLHDAGKARSNFTFNVSRYGETAYIDLISDGTEGSLTNKSDNYLFSWYVAHRDNDYLASIPYDIVRDNSSGGSARGADIAKKEAMKPYVEANGHSVEASGLRRGPNFDYAQCEFSYKDNFNITLSRYNPEALDHSTIAGKLLGQKGMEFKEWVRRTDNLREYLAIEKSAREVTQAHCKPNKFTDTNLCHTELSKDFHKCYMRAIGYRPANTRHFSFEPIKDFERFKVSVPEDARDNSRPNIREDKWMHSIRANTNAFVSCFALGPEAKNLIDIDLKSFNDPSFFEDTQQGEDFAQRIVNQTQWPSSINPLGGDENEEDAATPDPETTCSLGKMGWILCPVMSFLSKIADSLFGFLEGWMQIPPMIGSNEHAAFRAWTYLRDFGNILFATLLLGIVIIQVTGGTLSGYTIRKKAPHIAVTALLINISFILCSILIDVSNILGASLLSTIHSFSVPQVDVDGFSNWEAITTSVAFAGGALAGTAAVITSVAALVPMLITAVFSMVIILVLLLMRQALVIILVVLSPLAIATRLLPGTEQWFKRWKSLFIQMVMLYPAIALVFGGAYFASSIIMSSAAEQGGLNGALLAIFGLALQVIPLFISPIVLKLGGSAINSVGGMMRGKMSGAQSASIKAANSASENVSDRMNIRASQGGLLGANRRRKMRKSMKKSFRQREISRSQSAGTADTKVGRFVAGVAGGGLNKGRRDDIQAALAAEAEKLSQENIRAARLRIEDDSELLDKETALEASMEHAERALSSSTDLSERIAHMQKTVENGDVKAIDHLIDNLESMPPEQRREFAKSIDKSNVGKTAAHLSDPSTANSIADGSATVHGLHQAAAKRGAYSTQDTASRQSAQAMDSMKQHLSPEQLASFKKTYAAAADSGAYAQNMTKAAADKERTL